VCVAYPDVDSGMLVEDAGNAVGDGGPSPADSGPPLADSGAPMTDGAFIPPDAGPAPLDSGTPLPDAGGGDTAPQVTLTAQSIFVEMGADTVLSWTVTGATACTLNGGLVDAGGGNQTLPNTQSAKTHVLTCTGPGGTSTARVFVDVQCSVYDERGGDLHLQSQADVNAFSPGSCIRILGELQIGPSTDITDLSPLLGIFEVMGDTFIHANDALETLSGLHTLRKAWGRVAIGRIFDGSNWQYGKNPNLQSLEGLHGLVVVNNTLAVGNDPVQDLRGLREVRVVGAEFRVADCDNLVDLQGMENLQTIEGDLEVDKNDSLLSMEGLSGVNAVGEDMQIHDNLSLVTLAGLENIYSVGMNFELHDNASLQDVSALAGILTVGDEFLMCGNPQQTSMGVTDLLTLGGPTVRINNNMSLPDATSLAAVEAWTGLDLSPCTDHTDGTWDIFVCAAQMDSACPP
jgi:hypothetical protein